MKVFQNKVAAWILTAVVVAGCIGYGQFRGNTQFPESAPLAWTNSAALFASSSGVAYKFGAVFVILWLLWRGIDRRRRRSLFGDARAPLPRRAAPMALRREAEKAAPPMREEAARPRREARGQPSPQGLASPPPGRTYESGLGGLRSGRR